ncbi:MAG: MFS transporter [Rhodobacterales bacterium]|nr:MFS transporter [Rhodobacterales bacterium]
MTHPPSPPSDRARRATMAALVLSMLLASLGTSIANIALPALAEAFAAPIHQVQWVVIAYLTGLTVSVVGVGRLGDRYGLARLHKLGLVVFTGASVLCGLAPGLWSLVAARAVQGVGAAFLMTLTLALMRQTAGDARVGRAMGLLGTVSALGTALGPSLGGAVLAAAGWRGVFLVQVPLAVLALGLSAAFLPRDGARDGAGDGGPGPGWRAVLDRAVLSHLAANGLVAAVMMTTLVVGPFFLGPGLGLAAAVVGLVMSVGPVVSIVTGVPSGRAVDAWGAGRILGLGLVLLAAGSFGLAVLSPLYGVAGYVAAIVVLTPGYQLFQAANNTAVMADVGADRRGVVSGLLGLSRNGGLIAGAWAMGAVFAFSAGTGDIGQATPADIAHGLRTTFLLAGGLMVAAMGLVFGRRRAG